MPRVPNISTATPQSSSTVVGETGGVVKRFAASALVPFVNVKWFGAVGDGVTDDTAAINLAITAAQGGRLFFPAGSYLVSSGLTFPATNSVEIEFARGAKTLAGADNITIFAVSGSWYRGQASNVFIDGNGHAGVVGFDLTHFAIGSSLVRCSFSSMATGIIYRSLCGGVIDTPDFQDVTAPIVIMAGSSATQIRAPQIDGFGTIGIEIKADGTYPNVGVEVLGGFIQGGEIGVQDGGVSTKVHGTYFETCTVADVSLVSGSRHFSGVTTNHTASGVVAYKGRNAQNARIYHPFMASGARSTGVFDFDGTNALCLADFRTGGGGENIPNGTMTGISTVWASPQPIGATAPSSGAFTTISATGVSTLAGGVKTASGSVSAATATATTLLTVDMRGLYEVVAMIANSGAIAQYSASASVLFDGAEARITSNDGAALTLTLSGLDVRTTQSSGTTQTVYYSYRLLPL